MLRSLQRDGKLTLLAQHFSGTLKAVMDIYV